MEAQPDFREIPKDFLVAGPEAFERMSGIHVQNCKIELMWHAMMRIADERHARTHTHIHAHTHIHIWMQCICRALNLQQLYMLLEQTSKINDNSKLSILGKQHWR